jgi:hypothetical protein
VLLDSAHFRRHHAAISVLLNGAKGAGSDQINNSATSKMTAHAELSTSSIRHHPGWSGATVVTSGLMPQAALMFWGWRPESPCVWTDTLQHVPRHDRVLPSSSYFTRARPSEGRRR